MNSIDINPSNNPSNKDVVLLLCTHIRDEEREISSKSGTKKVIYSVWKCPNHNCVTKGEIKFQKQSGRTAGCRVPGNTCTIVAGPNLG